VKLFRSLVIFIFGFFLTGLIVPPAHAETLQLVVAEDRNSGYSRALFKHWIDADKNGCDTRAEVLIEEAIVKPKKGSKCKLSGGKWKSSYDGKFVTNASQLDIDHMVPLAEAWRSGAWNWSAKKRQDYANDLDDSRALIAVTLSTNRSKGDKDPALWMPALSQCDYVSSWIAIKWRYDLTVDSVEANKLKSLVVACGLTNVIIGQNNVAPSVLPTPSQSASPTSTPSVSATPTPTPSVSATPTPTPSVSPTPTPSVSPTPTPSVSPTPTPTTSYQIITPGAFCSPAGAIGKSSSGVTYTCKTSSTDTRNRWRQ
jgi:cell division septation protein DedD